MAEPAPYRFVPLSETVIPSPVQSPSHVEPVQDQKSGLIDVIWQAHGPFLLGDRGSDAGGGPVRPFVLAADGSAGRRLDLATAAIPGTSLRGMLRAAFEIVTYSRLSLFNARYRFGFRDFDDEDYADVLKAGSVRAGWLERDDDGSLHLRPCPWRKVSIVNLVDLVATCDQGTEWKYRKLSTKYTTFGIFSNSTLPKYRWDASFLWSESLGKVLSQSVDDRPDDCQPCDLVFSGKLPPAGGGTEPLKQFEYAFIVDTSSCRRAIESEIFEDFCRVHGKPKADGGIEADGSWKELEGNLDPAMPREHRRVPVFFVGDIDDQLSTKNRLRIGLTRLFKLAHRFAVGDLVPESHRCHSPLDMTEALFGYVDEPPDEARPTALRSRVAFGIAGITEESANACELGAVEEAVLMTPRASFDPYYLSLVPANREAKLSYSAADNEGRPLVRLAGRKRYPIRSAPAFDEMRRIAGRAANNVKSRLQFLKRQDNQPIQFASRIRFHNLHPVELGALVWTLRLGGFGYHSIGRAKPYGFGWLSVGGESSMVVNGGPRRRVTEVAPELEKPFLDYMQDQLKEPLLKQMPIKLLLFFAQPRKMDPLAAAGLLSYPGASGDDSNSAKAYKRIKERRREAERHALAASENVVELRKALREPVLALHPPGASRES